MVGKAVYPKQHSDKGEDTHFALTKILFISRKSRFLRTFMYRNRYSVKHRKERHPQLRERDLHAVPSNHVKGLPAMLFSAEGQKKAPDPLYQITKCFKPTSGMHER